MFLERKGDDFAARSEVPSVQAHNRALNPPPPSRDIKANKE